MKRIYFIISTFLIGINALYASEAIDSVSYAYGHQFTLATMAGKNDLMESKEDFENYIRGLEENSRQISQMNDSSYMMSYMLGGMEGVFITDGIHHKKKEDLPPFPCIIAGLRKVGNGEVSLPADTVAAMDLINRYGNKEMRPSDLDDDTECRFFTAYGVMKAYQPGLQKYIDGIRPGTKCVENRQAYATGMADVLETCTEVPKTAYDIGKSMSLSINLGAMQDDSLEFASFIAGAKAALGLGEQVISRDEVEKIIDLRYMQECDSTDKVYIEKLGEYIDKLDVQLDMPYSIDWKVTAGSVADVGTSAFQAFYDVVSKLNILDAQISGILMAQSRDEDVGIYEAALSAISNTPLPEGYKWFCGRTDDCQTTVGIMQTVPLFQAEVREATVDFDHTSGMMNVQWRFDVTDALKWAEFTENNISKHVAVEIDGRFMFAPRVNQQITGGSCAITGLTAEEINRLFKNAEKAVDLTPVDTIEVIEIK